MRGSGVQVAAAQKPRGEGRAGRPSAQKPPPRARRRPGGNVLSALASSCAPGGQPASSRAHAVPGAPWSPLASGGRGG